MIYQVLMLECIVNNITLKKNVYDSENFHSKIEMKCYNVKKSQAMQTTNILEMEFTRFFLIRRFHSV